MRSPFRCLAPSAAAAALSACGSAEPAEEPAVWTEDARAISVTWSGFVDGTMHFENSDARLTPTQRALIEQLRRVEEPECAGDRTAALVEIDHVDGTRTRYSSRSCSSEWPPIGYAPLELLSAEVGCAFYGGGSGRDAIAPWSSPSASEVAAELPSLRSGDGCPLPIARSPQPGAEFRLRVIPSATGAQRVTLASCEARSLELSLFDVRSGEELVASTAPRGTCPALESTLESRGGYVLSIRDSDSSAPGLETTLVRLDPIVP